MKFYVCLLCCLSIIGVSVAQKPVIYSSTYATWPTLGYQNDISNDGKYVFYTIENHPVGSKTLVFKSTESDWQQEFIGFKGYPTISADSRNGIFIGQDDTLFILTLGKSLIEKISGVDQFDLSQKDSSKWLFYRKKNNEKKLIVHDLLGGNENTFDSVESYLYCSQRDKLIFKRSNGNKESIVLVDFKKAGQKTIWEGEASGNLLLSPDETQLAFISKMPSTLWQYQMGNEKAMEIHLDTAMLNRGNLSLQSLNAFSKTADRLFVTLVTTNKLPKPKSDAVKLNIWSYTDGKLQSQQLKEGNRLNKSYLGVINLTNGKVIQLEQKGDQSWRREAFNDWELIEQLKSEGGAGEENWNFAWKRDWFLASTITGERKKIELEDAYGSISSFGKYVVYYNYNENNYFTYEIATGIIRNVTKNKASEWTGIYKDDFPNSAKSMRGVAMWLENDEAVLIYDKFDIWKIDPKGIKPPQNVTNGFGKKNSIVFSMLGDNKTVKNKLTLIAFNLKNKDNGFYKVDLNQSKDPELLTMGQFIYTIPDNPYVPDGVNFNPVKAKNADAYIVRRMSANNAPNYYFTRTFKKFKPLSDLHPEKAVNWYTTELHKWKAPDGQELQGILYKPENFDPNKKYPVIFYYYERKSDGLNAYLKPDCLSGGCSINVPTYVSNGYLVFMPDIHFNIGETGESVVNAVTSAAKYLNQLPFVDSKRMGIQGCSLGGYETNYLVTHTNLFAAACSASGISDFVSGYASLAGDGSILQAMYEQTSWRMKYTLWEKPEWYIKNSPVFSLNKVTTPFLMMHTTQDGVCPFPQAVEMFTGLRRLGKKVWMLEYEDGSHGVWGKSAEDFSVRMMQFFDHYLKDKPAPKWMTQGRPAALKGFDERLELDSPEVVP